MASWLVHLIIHNKKYSSPFHPKTARCELLQQLSNGLTSRWWTQMEKPQQQQARRRCAEGTNRLGTNRFVDSVTSEGCTLWTSVDQKDPMSRFDTKGITSHRMEMAQVGCETAVRFVIKL